MDALRAVPLSDAMNFVASSGVSAHALIDTRPDFATAFPLSEAREQLAARLGVDTGFSMATEGFSAMLALELLPSPVGAAQQLLHDRLAAVVSRHRRGNRYRFFASENDFPADTDCTAVAASGLFRRGLLTTTQLAHTARELLSSTCASPTEGLEPGVFMVYWDDPAEPQSSRRGRKHDAVACANALHAVKLAGVAESTSANLSYLRDHLVSGRYRAGTRYYPSPEAFLWAASRLSHRFSDAANVLSTPLRQAVRDAEPQHPLDLALQIIAADHLEIQDLQGVRRRALADRQQRDGSWSPGPLYRMGRFPVYFGSSFLTTLFAIRALMGVHNGG